MKNAKLANLITYILSAIASLLAVLFDMPIRVFTAIMVLGGLFIFACIIILFVINQCRENNSNELRQLRRSIIQLDDDESDEKVKKKIMKEEREERKNKLITQHQKIKGYIKIAMIVMAIIYFPRSKPLTSFAEQVIDVALDPFNEVAPTPESPTATQMPSATPMVTPTEEPTPTATPTEVPTPDPNNNSTNQKDWVRFILEYPNGYPNIEDDKFEELQNLLFYLNEDNLDEKMIRAISVWINSSKIDTSLANAVTSSGRSTQYYSDIEAEFSNESGETLSSKLWDELITGRTELLKLYPNGTLAWNLANNHQTYALNYSDQTSDGKSILYFYMKSIEYTQKSLEFEMDKETKYERIRYLRARYKDIAECESIKEKPRLKAYKIYIAIQNALEELGIPQQ